MPAPVKFVLYEDSAQMWRVQAVTVEGTDFANRLSLAEPWRGLRDAALCEAFARAACGTAVKRHFLGEGSMLACVGGALEGEAVLAAEVSPPSLGVCCGLRRTSGCPH